RTLPIVLRATPGSLIPDPTTAQSGPRSWPAVQAGRPAGAGGRPAPAASVGSRAEEAAGPPEPPGCPAVGGGGRSAPAALGVAPRVARAGFGPGVPPAGAEPGTEPLGSWPERAEQLRQGAQRLPPVAGRARLDRNPWTSQ